LETAKRKAEYKEGPKARENFERQRVNQSSGEIKAKPQPIGATGVKWIPLLAFKRSQTPGSSYLPSGKTFQCPVAERRVVWQTVQNFAGFVDSNLFSPVSEAWD
jgi:hypothetical protein